MAKSVKKNNTFGVLNNLPNPTPTPTYTDTHTHTDTHIVKERKTRRVQLLLKESTVNELDAYAKRIDTSRNEIIQNLIEDFLSNV
jgi:hypothetical protein